MSEMKRLFRILSWLELLDHDRCFSDQFMPKSTFRHNFDGDRMRNISHCHQKFFIELEIGK